MSKSSRGSDDIFLASTIYYLIIHCALCWEKKGHAYTGTSPNLEELLLASK